jgi:hypothetical protein
MASTGDKKESINRQSKIITALGSKERRKHFRVAKPREMPENTNGGPRVSVRLQA